MAFQIEFSDIAKAETDAAYLYLSRRSPEMAIRWLRGLDAALTSLAASLTALPGRRSLAPENGLLPDIEVYQLIYGKGMSAYRVLYYFADADGDGTADMLRVLHVRHGAQRGLDQSDEDDA